MTTPRGAGVTAVREVCSRFVYSRRVKPALVKGLTGAQARELARNGKVMGPLAHARDVPEQPRDRLLRPREWMLVQPPEFEHVPVNRVGKL